MDIVCMAVALLQQCRRVAEGGKAAADGYDIPMVVYDGDTVAITIRIRRYNKQRMSKI